MKRPKTYVVTEKQAMKIFEGCYNCATDDTPKHDQLWNAVKAAFPGLWEEHRQAARKAA
jgi:hypothetical protein